MGGGELRVGEGIGGKRWAKGVREDWAEGEISNVGMHHTLSLFLGLIHQNGSTKTCCASYAAGTGQI